jgi:NADP-reducing hydrogenase subunit HndB
MWPSDTVELVKTQGDRPMADIKFLKSVDIFKGLSEDQLKEIQAGCREIEFQIGSKLFAEGDKSDRIWIVVSGQVDLRFELPGRTSTEENTIFSITTGNTLGWSSFVPPFQYKLSAYCATRTCKMLQIENEFLTNLFEKDTQMGFLVVSNLTGVASSHFHRLQNSAAGAPTSSITVTVHMATCGIAAGARQIMTALMDEIYDSGRQDIRVKSSGCIGKCPSEPNVTIEITGEESVLYQKMTPDKMRQVFKKHVLKGEVQEDYRLNIED